MAESKPYRSAFVWAQCTAWFKQTVYDPTASLSAERRGMLSLPDIETAYSGVSGLCLAESPYVADDAFDVELCLVLVALERKTEEVKRQGWVGPSSVWMSKHCYYSC